MDDNEHYYRLLVQRYVEKKATDEELEVFAHLLKEGKLDPCLTEAMNRDAGITAGDELQFVQPVKVRRLWYRIAAAASVVLVLSIGGYFILHKTQNSQLVTQNSKNDIAPGGNKATLTLSDGRKIVLSEAKNGTIASQGKTLINKTADGKIIYAGNSPSGTGSGELPAVYNILSTKRGEQYHVTLPDGSKVFLNAASSLRYPVAFTGKERKVELTGEAYFEVVHNAAQPFKVAAGSQTIEDIGTQFDVNAYADEPAELTTLVEGAVRVNALVLKPGEQTDGKTIRAVDPQTVVAWKNGKFYADSVMLEEIMRQVARWYNVKVVFENNALRNQTFGIIGNRYANVADLLHSLELTQKVKFRIQNRTIYVLNPN